MYCGLTMQLEQTTATKQNHITELLLNEKPVFVLVTLTDGEKYGSEIADEIDTTYAHTVKILSDLKERGLVRSEKDGRKKYIFLTEKGRELANSCTNLVNTANVLEASA